MLQSKEYGEILRKAQVDSRFFSVCIIFSFISAVSMSLLILLLSMRHAKPLYYSLLSFPVIFAITFIFLREIPVFIMKNKKAELESDLLYSARHLLLKLESGSSLLNALESVSNLNTKSSNYFRTIVFDISLGMTVEYAIKKSIDMSPSRAYTKILEEIEGSIRTGSDIEKTLRSTLDEISKLHLIQIEEYGKKLNPMSLFYMIIGTILPSLGTAMLVVAASLLPSFIIIDSRILVSVIVFLLIVQIFFVLAFKSLKPAVME